MPRWCPLCQHASIIGHGQRCKSAHDEQHDCVWVRRGRCRLCGKTFTILPSWSLPYGHYTLHCRKQAWDAVCTDGENWEQAAPLCKDPTRLPDPSTLRRWARRKMMSLWADAKGRLLATAQPKFCTHPPSSPGIGRQPYSAARGNLPMSWQTADLLKQQIPLLDHLEGQGWKAARQSACGRVLGLCPLHPDQRPSLLVDPSKNLFYCYG